MFGHFFDRRVYRFIKCENTSFFKFILPLSSNFKRIFFFSIKNYLLLYSKHKIYFEECYRNFYIYYAPIYYM